MSDIFKIPGNIWDSAADLWTKTEGGLRKTLKKPQAAEAPPADAPLPDPLATAVAEPKPVMPTPDDAAVKAAKKRSIALQLRQRGRASTILTDVSGGGLGG